MADPTARRAPTQTVDATGGRTTHGRAVRTTGRWVVGLIVLGHGTTHVVGAAKALGWARVTQLADPDHHQVVIFTSWADAEAGTIANVVLLLGVGCGWAS